METCACLDEHDVRAENIPMKSLLLIFLDCRAAAQTVTASAVTAL